MSLILTLVSLIGCYYIGWKIGFKSGLGKRLETSTELITFAIEHGAEIPVELQKKLREADGFR